MDQEIEWAAVTGMFDLANVLALIHDRLDERPLAQQEAVGEMEELIAPILAPFGAEPQSVGEQEALGERRGERALVAQEASEQATDQAGNWTPVVGGARSET